MTKEEVTPYIIEVIKEKLRHDNYDHVAGLADKYETYYTGKGLDDELQQFTPREEDELFTQRKKITKHIVTSIAWNVTSVEKKVPRSNGITKAITYDEKGSDKKLEELEGILGKFWGDASWDRYMEVRWVELNDLDPNTFVAFEWGNFNPVKELLQPYPFEITAHEAIDFKYKNNILQYLTSMFVIEMPNEQDEKAKPKDGEKYIIYLPDETIIITEFWNESYLNQTVDEQARKVMGDMVLRIKNRLFRIEYPKPHKQGYVPAFRVGWKRDPATRGATYIAPWHASLPYLEKIVKANSELDLTMALHTFPQKVIMVPKCDNPNCFDGVVTLPDGQKQKCPDCQGTGLQVHRSSQDIIAVPLPKTGEEQLSLDDLFRYIDTPIDLPRFQDEYIEKMTQRCIQVVYNSDIFTRSQIAETATEKRIDLDNIYDALYPMSVKYSSTYKFGVRTIAKLIDRDKGLIVVHSFSKDFRFKSKDDYIAERKAAVEAQAPPEVLAEIDREIKRIDTADNPDDFRQYEVKTDMDPFEGKSQAEIQFIITNNNVPRRQIVLYSCYGFIYDEIIITHPEFYELTKDKRLKIVYEVVDKYIAEIDKNKTATEPPEFE